MKPIVLIFLIGLSSCCREITSSVEKTTKVDSFTDTIYVPVPFITEPAASKPMDINLSTLCDSLYRGQLKPQTRTSEPKSEKEKRQLIAHANILMNEVDSMYHLHFMCKEDAYKDTLDSVRTLNKMLIVENTVNKSSVLTERWYEDKWLYISVVLLLLNLIQWKKK